MIEYIYDGKITLNLLSRNKFLFDCSSYHNCIVKYHLECHNLSSEYDIVNIQLQ